MPIAIKKEMVFGLLILLLVILFVLNMTKKGNTGVSKFGDLMGEDGIQIIESNVRNALDSSVTYTLPGTVTISGNVASYYKWPLLYLIDANNARIDAATLSSDAAYKKPPPKALLNSANVTYDTGASVGTIGYYAPASVPSGNFFPNLINLTNLYGTTTNQNLQAPSTGAFSVNSDIVAASSTGTWIIPGLSTVINAPLILGRKYILGVSAQLTNSYVNLYGTSKYVVMDPINKRYGNFVYVYADYSGTGLTVTVPNSPTGASAATLTLTI